MRAKFSKIFRTSKRAAVFVAINFAIASFSTHLAWGLPSLGAWQEPQKTKTSADSIAAAADTMASSPKRGTDLPTTAAAWYMQGLEQLKEGQLERAATSFDEALRLDPNHVKALVNLARVYIEQKRFEKALDAVNRAIAVDSTSAEAYLVYGRIMYSQEDWPAAIAAYKHSIELTADNPYALNNLALIYIQQEQFDEAIPQLEKAIAQKPDVAFFHNNLGVALQHTGDLYKAIDAFQAALEIDSNYEKAQANLEYVQKLLDEKTSNEPSSEE